MGSEEKVNIAKLFLSAVETQEPEEVPIQGELPQWVKGTYFRVGPNKFDFEKFTMNHMFDGYAMLQKFEILEGKVIFEKKYLQSDSFKRAMAAQRPVITEFGTSACSDPNKSIIGKFMSAIVPEFTDNNYSALFKMGGDLFSVCDSCYFRQIDTDNIGKSPEKYDSNKFFGLNTISSHPLTDQNGDVWNVGYALFSGLKYQIVKTPKAATSREMLKKSKVVASIPSRWNGGLATVHSFGMSVNHVVLIEHPLILSVARLCASLVKRDSVHEWLEWKQDETNRFIVVNKNSGKINKTEYFSAESFYFLHVVNCYEEDKQIILDVVGYASPAVLDSLYLKDLRNNVLKPTDYPQVHRYVLPMLEDFSQVPEATNLVEGPYKAKSERKGTSIICSPEFLLPHRGLEVPTVNPKYIGEKYTIFYGAGTINENWARNKVCKVNTETRDVTTFCENGQSFPGEPVFLPSPEAQTEDDGIIIAAISTVKDDHKDFLVFLDKYMKEVARATFNNDIPSAIHGIFVDGL